MKHISFKRSRWILIGAIATLTLSGCDSWFGEKKITPLNAEQIARLMPPRGQDRASWARDIVAVSDELNITRNPSNMCSIIAIVDQESNFKANPQVAGLGEKAAREIKARLQEKFGATMAGYFETMLQNKPTPDNNYLSRIRRVKTEKDLDLIYREMFDYYSAHYHISLLTGAAKLVGQNIAEHFNPITTLGSMQVQIQYAADHKRKIMNINQLRDEIYTQFGGLYYGIHRLMVYTPRYDKALYRFADYNSGMYSSRNAAFQKMLNQLTHNKLSLDGDLLLYTKDGDVKLEHSSTENALIAYFSQDPTAPTARAIRNDLKGEKSASFEKSATYQYVVNQYQAKTKKTAPYAIMPQVVISGPKLRRDYDTNWYATRVNGRYMQCMQQAKHLKLK